MSELVVRAYNALFGDAVLVSIPDRAPSGEETVRHLLIDVGNLTANSDKVLKAIVTDIAERTHGTVDLYVMTHEHLDHVAGLLTAHRAKIKLKARHAWLTGSAAPDYYERHVSARRQKKRHLDDLASVANYFRAGVRTDPWLEAMIRNNGGVVAGDVMTLSTGDYVDHLRQLAAPNEPTYVDRETKLKGKHPFKEAMVRVLAPEEDTSVYYREPRPRLTAATEGGTAPSADPLAPPRMVPPVGIETGPFVDLVRARHRVNRQTVLAIDEAANNTSVVLELEWRGWRLLLGGDAEELSWQMMLEAGRIRPVHFLKIAHHGSVNGSVPQLVEAAFPEKAPDDRARRALVSTHDQDWPSVPDRATLATYSSRVTLLDTRTVNQGEALEISFPG